MTKIEKLGMMLLALLLATLFLISLSIKDGGEKDTCESMCGQRDSVIRVYEPGICICQK